MRWLDDMDGSAVLSPGELASVLERVGGIAPGHELAAAVARDVAGSVGGWTKVLRCLLADEPGDARQRLERLVATEPVGGADRAVLRRCGELWEVKYAGRGLRLRHAQGLTYLAALVAQPRQRLAASDLVARGGRCAPPDLARLSVTKAIGSVLARLADAHPELHAHLAVTIRRGNSCVYTPDPRRPIQWLTASDGTTVPSEVTPALE